MIPLPVDAPVAISPRLIVGLVLVAQFTVVGTRGLSGVRSALAGSVTNHLTHNVLVPVLAVPPEDGR
jgi:nucleotide-binding universal stress UspA family protein